MHESLLNAAASISSRYARQMVNAKRSSHATLDLFRCRFGSVSIQQQIFYLRRSFIRRWNILTANERRHWVPAYMFVPGTNIKQHKIRIAFIQSLFKFDVKTKSLSCVRINTFLRQQREAKRRHSVRWKSISSHDYFAVNLAWNNGWLNRSVASTCYCW